MTRRSDWSVRQQRHRGTKTIGNGQRWTRQQSTRQIRMWHLISLLQYCCYTRVTLIHWMVEWKSFGCRSCRSAQELCCSLWQAERKMLMNAVRRTGEVGRQELTTSVCSYRLFTPVDRFTWRLPYQLLSIWWGTQLQCLQFIPLTNYQKTLDYQTVMSTAIAQWQLSRAGQLTLWRFSHDCVFRHFSLKVTLKKIIFKMSNSKHPVEIVDLTPLPESPYMKVWNI